MPAANSPALLASSDPSSPTVKRLGGHAPSPPRTTRVGQGASSTTPSETLPTTRRFTGPSPPVPPGSVAPHGETARGPRPSPAANDQGGARSELYDPLGDATHDQALHRPQPPATDHHEADPQLSGQTGDLFGGATFSEVRPRHGPPGSLCLLRLPLQQPFRSEEHTSELQS